MARTITEQSDRGRVRGAHQPVAHLIRLLDFERPQRAGARHALTGLDVVELDRRAEGGGGVATATRVDRTLRIEVDDPRMSARHARMTHHLRRWTIVDQGSRNGIWIDGRGIEDALLEDGAVIELGRTAFLFRVLEVDGGPPDVDAAALPMAIPGVATFAPGFGAALADLAKLARTGQSVVLRGETGTGKEVLGRGVHAASGRSGAWVAVNCGALPDHLIESELFGHRKGSFSGATEDRPGLVRAADGGTLFLDEIADLPLASQAALLRVLQEHEVTPVGGTRAVAVDLRVIAASHRDLEAEVAAGRFREDLLARLAGAVVEVPPVRARREDLGLLIAALLARLPDGERVKLSPEAGRALLRYRWPRNVRELEQALATAVALADGRTIEVEHLPPAVRAIGDDPPTPPVEDLSPSDRRRRDELIGLLTQHRGNIAAVARAMGVERMQIHRWLKRFALAIEAYRPAGDGEP
jgi:pSer/pThr/pTyr-binding forkhead associated (FHA) protein